MSKGRKVGIIVGCIVAAIIVMIIAMQSLILPSRRLGYLPVSGSYMLTDTDVSNTSAFRESDVGHLCIDLKSDRTFCLRYIDEDSAYMGKWISNGHVIVLQREYWDSQQIWTGTVNRNTIFLEDGSVWKRE